MSVYPPSFDSSLLKPCSQVFCYPCVLHLINTSDNKWVRCPICFDSINERQLKAVKWYEPPPQADDEVDHIPEASSSSSTLGVDPTGAPRPGSILHMRLMQRPTITTLALPRSDTWPSDLLPPHQAPFHFLPDVYEFSKFMLATPTYLLDDLTKDLDQLAAERRSLAGMKDELGITFVDAAEQKVRLQMERVAAMETPLFKHAVEKALKDQTEIVDRLARLNLNKEVNAPDRDASRVTEVPEAFLAAQQGSFNPKTPTSTVPHIASPVRNPRQRRNINPPPPSTSTYYFYQAASGQPVFLHPLDIRVLHSHFDDYAAFPNRITIRVEAATASTVNDDLRKRCKYLGHFPEGADVVFVEADLGDVVGTEGVQAFEGALKSRRARRRDKDRKDNNARARAEEREKERRAAELSGQWTRTTWTDPGRVVSVPNFEAPRMEEFPAPESTPEPVVNTPAPVANGAWGALSFASAAHRAPTGAARPREMVAQRREVNEDWDFDGAWDDLEQSIASNGGRKKRGSRMVVLGGGGGRRR
jgi:hypothetical protein